MSASLVAVPTVLDTLFDRVTDRSVIKSDKDVLPIIVKMFADHYSATWCDARSKSTLVLRPNPELTQWTRDKGLYKKYRQPGLTFTRTIRSSLIGRPSAAKPDPAPQSLSVVHFGGAIEAVPVGIAQDFGVSGPGPVPAGSCSTIFCFYVDMTKLSTVQSADACDLLIRLSNMAGSAVPGKRVAAEAGLDDQQAKRRG